MTSERHADWSGLGGPYLLTPERGQLGDDGCLPFLPGIRSDPVGQEALSTSCHLGGRGQGWIPARRTPTY